MLKVHLEAGTAGIIGQRVARNDFEDILYRASPVAVSKHSADGAAVTVNLNALNTSLPLFCHVFYNR